MLEKRLREFLETQNAQGAFLLKNLKNGESAEYQADLVVPSASLIKMFVMIEAVRRIREGQLGWDTSIPVGKKSIVPFSVLAFLEPRAYQLKELLKLMIVYSDNTATNVLIDYLGYDSINKTIKAIDCDNSILHRKMMDFQAAKDGKENRTNVRDMAKILENLYQSQLLGSPYDEAILSIMKGQADECMMRVDLPDELTIARKSGELDCLDHDIAIVYGEKTDYIYIFFVWEAVSNNAAREVLAKTSKEVFDYFNAK